MTELKEIRERIERAEEENAALFHKEIHAIFHQDEMRFVLTLLQQGREYAWHKQGCYFFSRNKNKICDCGYAEWLKAVSDE